MLEAAQKLAESEKKLRKQLEAQQMKRAAAEAGDLLEQAREVKGVRVVAARVEGVSRPAMRQMIDTLRPKYQAALKKATADSTADIKRGVGISLGVYGSGLDGPDTAEVDAELNADGTVSIFTTWHDHGQRGRVRTDRQAQRLHGQRPRDHPTAVWFRLGRRRGIQRRK